MIKFNGKEYDDSPNSPFSCGVTASYYRSIRQPYKKCPVHKIKLHDLTPEEVEAYRAGVEWNETVNMDFKSWD